MTDHNIAAGRTEPHSNQIRPSDKAHGLWYIRAFQEEKLLNHKIMSIS